MNSLTITNTAVSGTPLRLLNGKLDYSWNNLIQDFPIPGKFDIIKTQYQGWKNPGFNLTFYIYIDINPSGCITWAQWNAVVRNNTVNTTLALTLGDSDTAFKSYAHNASGVSSIPIQIVNYNVSIEPDSNVLIINAQCIESI